MNYGAIKDLAQLQTLCDALLEQGKTIGFDVETGYQGPDREKGALWVNWAEQFVVGFSITNDKRWARYVPLRHDEGPNLPEREAWEIVQPVLETLPVVAHHLKFEQKNLQALEWKGCGPSIDIKHGRDTMLQAYILSEWQGFGLKDLVKWVFDHDMAKIDSLFPGWSQNKLKTLRFNLLGLTPEVVEYACEDAAWALALDEELNERAQAERAQMYVIEHQISELMREVETFGMAVAWNEMKEEYARAQPFRDRMEKATREGLSNLAGRDLTDMNLGSSPQLQALLYRDVGLKTTRLTDSAKKAENADKPDWQKMSTDAVAMEGLSKDIPEVKKMLEFREVEVGLRRFKKWLNEYNISADDRIHASFNQVIVPSGRFSANDPAVQQMPKYWKFTTKVGANVSDPAQWKTIVSEGENYVDYWTGNFRDYVIAPPGTYLIGYDYSQIELRVLAGVSGEPALLTAFENDQDVHSLTAAKMLYKPVEDITEEERAVGKTQNFALMYQMGEQSLAERLAISLERAHELYENYFAQFSQVGNWMKRAVQVGQALGYAETPFGRKITVWELQHANRYVRNKGDRILINAPIQGGAADYMKMAMIRAWKALKVRGWWGTHVRLIHNLHDALTFEADNSVDPRELRELLQEAVVFQVPRFPKIVADWELGQRHGSCARWKDEDVALIDGHWTVLKEPQKAAQPVLTAVPDIPDEDMTAEEFDRRMAAGTPVEVDVQLTRVRDEFADPVEVIVTVAKMPSEAQARKLLQLVEDRPGDNTLVLQTPEGEIRLAKGCTLDVQDQGILSLVLGGASVRRAANSVDVTALAKGFDL